MRAQEAPLSHEVRAYIVMISAFVWGATSLLQCRFTGIVSGGIAELRATTCDINGLYI